MTLTYPLRPLVTLVSVMVDDAMKLVRTSSHVSRSKCRKATSAFVTKRVWDLPAQVLHVILGKLRSSITLSPRQQLNAITAFIDASNVYASNVTEALSLRDTTTNRGLLRVGARPDGKALLPFDNEGLLKHVDCQIEATKRHLPCFWLVTIV